MKKYNKLAVFGGTFSPVHNGHLDALKTYADVVKPDALYVIPTATPPHKMRVDDATDEDRLAMLRLAVSDLSLECDTVVSALELERGGKSYTVDTVGSLMTVAEEVIIYCGTDMLLTLDKWYHYEQLLKMCSVAYMQREDDLRYSGEVVEKVKLLSGTFGTKFIALPPVSDEISSSDIRQMVHDGKDITNVVPSKVAEYIYKHGLYK